MKRQDGLLWVAIAMIIVAAILGSAYKYKYKAQDRIVVTGLGETEFVSDLIVWNGTLISQAQTATAGYTQLEANKTKVQEYIRLNGIADSCVVFMFVNVNKQTDPIYSGGQYVGQRFICYELRQNFTVESKNVEAVETISREISSLIAQGVQIESWQPSYFYTKLSDVKLSLIEKATEDARLRAEKIASQTGAKLRTLQNARMGVFQITGANTNEEFSAGGNFNSSSKNKKAQITMRLEYHIK